MRYDLKITWHNDYKITGRSRDFSIIIKAFGSEITNQKKRRREPLDYKLFCNRLFFKFKLASSQVSLTNSIKQTNTI